VRLYENAGRMALIAEAGGRHRRADQCRGVQFGRQLHRCEHPRHGVPR
jgi:hypothetical protein